MDEDSPCPSVFLFTPKKFVHREKSSPVRSERRFSLRPEASTKTPKIISFIKNSPLSSRKHVHGDVQATPRRLRRFSLRHRDSATTGIKSEDIFSTWAPSPPQVSLNRQSQPQSQSRPPAHKRVEFRDPWATPSKAPGTFPDTLQLPKSPRSTKSSRSPRDNLSQPVRARNNRTTSSSTTQTPSRAGVAASLRCVGNATAISGQPHTVGDHRDTVLKVPVATSLFPRHLPLPTTPKRAKLDKPSHKTGKGTAARQGDRNKHQHKEAQSSPGFPVPDPPLVIQRREVGSSDGKSTVWYESCLPEPLDWPEVQAWLFPGDLYVHYHRKGRQTWMRDDRGDWIWAYESKVHPQDSSRVLSILSSGEPRWVRRA